MGSREGFCCRVDGTGASTGFAVGCPEGIEEGGGEGVSVGREVGARVVGAVEVVGGTVVPHVGDGVDHPQP